MTRRATTQIDHHVSKYYGDIEIELDVETLADRFLTSPNDLHRAKGDWSGLTLRARAMLAALLTMRTGWRTSRKVIDDLAPELGHKGVSTVLTELRERGFLTAEKNNGAGGRFTWRWRVSMRPRGVSAGRTIAPSGDDGGSTIVPSGDDGSDQGKRGVSAGRTIAPSATDGQGDALRRPSGLEDLEELPPLPHGDQLTHARARETNHRPDHRTDMTTTDEVTAVTMGGEDPENQEEQKSADRQQEAPAPPPAPAPVPDRCGDPIAAAVTDAIGHQSSWTSSATRAALIQAIREGMDQGVAIKALGDLARGVYGPTIAGPQRLLAAGPWRRPGEVFVPAPRPAERSICPQHLGQPAGYCRVCASERIERLAPPEREATPTTPMRAKAIAAARETLRVANARWTAEARRAHRHKTTPTTV